MKLLVGFLPIWKIEEFEKKKNIVYLLQIKPYDYQFVEPPVLGWSVCYPDLKL